MSLTTPFQTVISLAPFILDPTGTITKGGKTILSSDSGPRQTPPNSSITPPSPWTSIGLESINHEEGEGDIKGTEDELLHWRREEDHETTNPPIDCLQQDHEEPASNAARWGISQGTAQRNRDKQT